MGDTSQGSVLRGQVQGVKRGVGVIIFPNGSISFDPTTATGVVKTNNPSAFNSYIWPDANGTANQVLTTSDDGTLSWGDVADDFFKNIFTAKGQLIVGAGVKSYTLQNVGINTAFAVANSATASGLIYTNNSSSSVLLPVGTSAQRDCYCDPLETALTGQFRYSTTFDTLEFYNGVKWIQVAGSDVSIETFVKQTVPLTGTASAVIIGGTSAQRQNAPLAGYFRYNTDEKVPEFYDGTVWNTFIHSILPGTTGLTFTGVPTSESGIVQVGGTLVLANGGTGSTTQPGAANNILPPQATNSKKFLTTDGTNVSWSTLDGTGALTAGAGIGVAGGPSNTTVVSNTGIITNTAGPGIGVSTTGTNSTISNTGIITNTAGLGIGVSTTGTNSTITNTGVRSLVAGYGIDIDSPTGVSTISLDSGAISTYPSIFVVPLTPGGSTFWGDPGGLGPTSGSTDLFEVVYPAGPQFALLQTRLRCDLSPIAGADYSAAAGFGFTQENLIKIQITGEALPNTNLGLFEINPGGFIAAYSSGNFYTTTSFFSRTNQVVLTNPAGGSFFIQLEVSQVASGPNTVSFNSPQFVITPFSMP